MKRVRLIATLLLAAGCSEGVGPSARPSANSPTPATSEGRAPSPNSQIPILYHGGRILSDPKVAVIYWGKQTIYAGGPAVNTTGPGSADGSLVGYFLQNLGGSPYWAINSGYSDATGASVSNSLQYTQFWATDTLAPNPGASVSDTKIRKGLVYAFHTGRLTYDPQTIYVIFSESKVNLGGNFGNYCSYDTQFMWGTKRVLYVVMPYLADFPSYCTLLQGTSPNADFAADAITSRLAEELDEHVSDPDADAWFDASNAENGDKCGNFLGLTYTNSNGGLANMVLGEKDFLVQGNWVNSATQQCGLQP